MAEFAISIITQDQFITVTSEIDSNENWLTAAVFTAVFSDQVDWRNGNFIGRTYQQKTPELISKLRIFIQQNENLRNLWRLYDVLSDLENDEYFAVFPKIVNYDFQYVVKEQLYRINNPDFEKIRKFKEDICKGIFDNYSITYYPDGNKQIKIGEQDRKKRICRFCGRKMPEVTFAMDAHTISEGLGNKSIITNDECDICNETLGREIEQDLIAYLSPLRVFLSVSGKKGKRKIKDQSFSFFEENPKSLKFELFDQENPDLKHWTLKEEPDKLSISFTHPQMINLQDVYRTVVKYALGVIKVTQLVHFEKTIKWIKKETSSTDLPRLCFFFDPNPGQEERAKISVFIRKNDDKTLPFSFVELHVVGLIIFAIIPFSDQDDRTFSSLEDWKHVMDVLKIYRELPHLKTLIINKDENERITINLNFSKRNVNNDINTPLSMSVN